MTNSAIQLNKGPYFYKTPLKVFDLQRLQYLNQITKVLTPS